MTKPFSCEVSYSIDRNGIILYAGIPSTDLDFYSEDVFTGDYSFNETKKFDKLLSETLKDMSLEPVEVNSKKYSSHNLIEYKHK